MQEERYEHTVLFISRIKGQELPRRRGVAGADAPLPAEVVEVHSHPLSCSAALGFPTHDSFQEREAKDEPEECSNLPTAGTGTAGQDLSQIILSWGGQKPPARSLAVHVIVSQGPLRGSAPSRTARPSPPPRPQ